jgi:hypothetical protein
MEFWNWTWNLVLRVKWIGIVLETSSLFLRKQREKYVGKVCRLRL